MWKNNLIEDICVLDIEHKFNEHEGSMFLFTVYVPE